MSDRECGWSKVFFFFEGEVDEEYLLYEGKVEISSLQPTWNSEQAG